MSEITEIDLVALRKPAPRVRLPNEKLVQLRYLNGEGFALLWRWKANPGDGELFEALVKNCIPDATQEDIDSLPYDEAVLIIAAARKLIDLVETQRKNGGSDVADPAASPTPLSSQTT